jgi:hypothetical protein
LSHGAACSDDCAAVGDVESLRCRRYVVYFFSFIYPLFLSFWPLISFSASKPFPCCCQYDLSIPFPMAHIFIRISPTSTRECVNLIQTSIPTQTWFSSGKQWPRNNTPSSATMYHTLIVTWAGDSRVHGRLSGRISGTTV